MLDGELQMAAMLFGVAVNQRAGGHHLGVQPGWARGGGTVRDNGGQSSPSSAPWSGATRCGQTAVKEEQDAKLVFSQPAASPVRVIGRTEGDVRRIVNAEK